MRGIRPVRSLLFALLLLTVSSGAFGQVVISVNFGPPALPVYEQPLCPGDGYIWTPGYWAWDPDAGSYYWVPGTWVLAPEVGYLWTPPWWGWEGGVYLFHAGWWGPHVGFYGGINYGFGYTGDGYWGGRWDHDHFYYNREVTNINITNIHNVYNERVVINNNTRVAFNGGEGGIHARASAEQERWAGERHIEAVDAQRQHVEQARGNPDLRASANHGRPPIAATARAGEFHSGAVAARDAGGPYRPEGNPGKGGGNYAHVKDLPPPEHMPAPNTGNARLDQKYQRQQENLYSKQQQQRQNLQQKQEAEHARMTRQNSPPEYQQRVEQKHQQQTQQLAERHQQQREQMQARQSPPPNNHKK